jgi:hypothetical protein
MAKPNASFKFGKMNKIKLGNITDPVARSLFKKAMIDAGLSAIAAKARKFSDPAVTPRGGQNKGAPSTPAAE